MSTPAIDPGQMFDGVRDGVVDGVSDNLPAIGVLAGSLIAIGVVFSWGRKAAKQK